MNKLRPGKDGDPVPAGTLIFRIGIKTKLSPEALRKGKASPEMFELTSEDKESEGQRLSIWVEELTIADQAWDFMGAKPERNIVACLTVDKILSIPPQAGFEPPRVEWEKALTVDGEGRKIPNNRPGAEGHAGITGLNQGGDGKTHKRQRKAMRSDLADAADLSPVPVPHNIAEEHLRVAAYFIHENGGNGTASSDATWVSAIRQLRRARVREEARRKTEAARAVESATLT
jgi:hypothetical protein